MRIRWTPAAAADLQHISNYLKDRHPNYRQPTMRKLYEAIRSLKGSPHRGRLGREDGTRELLFPPLPYIAVYRVKDQDIEVLRIYHAAQDRARCSPRRENRRPVPPASFAGVIYTTGTGMKVYFGFTMAGDRSAVETARRIVGWLEEMGHEVLTRHLVSDQAWEMDRRISAEQVYERDMRWLAESDLLLAEVSGSSFGLGFETGYVLASTSKRAILFYRVEVRESISRMITGNTHPNCSLVPYAEMETVEAALRGLVGSAAPPSR
jgi:plasmid stabilization system protein ParE